MVYIFTFFALAYGVRRGYNACDMIIEPEYQDTLDYLYKYIDYSMVRNLRYSPEKFDLGRMYTFAAALGDPQRSYPVIHIAGTKGKGSVSALCARVLKLAGYRVGLYTSPHLSDYAERMQINNEPISHMDLVALVDAHKGQIESIPRLTTFEITTGLAFLYFKEQGVNAAVIEVGLGGRLDPTNITRPIVSVISSISYDHTKILGETLTEIAGEKAGIIKDGVPVVVSPQKDEARRVIERIASEHGAPVIQVGKDYLFRPLEHSLDGQSFMLWRQSEQARLDSFIESNGAGDWQPVILTIPLLGAHQVENAATAYATLQVCMDQGLVIPEQDIRDGFKSVEWPARFELLQRDPPVIIDSAHNRDSALKLRLALDEYFPGRPVVLVFGASDDKDIHGMYAELLPRVRQVITTRSTHPRAAVPESLVDLAHQFGCPALATQSAEEGLAQALKASDGEAVVLVAGSIFVAAAVRDVWQERVGGEPQLPVQS